MKKIINKKATISLLYQMLKGILIGLATYGATGIKTLTTLVWLLFGLVLLETQEVVTDSLFNILPVMVIGFIIYNFLVSFKKLRGAI